MGGIKTLAMVLAPFAAQAQAQPLSEAFASCAGRYSAELEHAWLLNDDRSVEFEHRLHQFADLVKATALQGDLRNLLNLRIETKLAHAGLLTQATFATDTELSDWAEARAASAINFCADFLLDS
ncbi:MAG: hypothetical protein AAF393_13225 [Pseudomonadota bacterium]